MSTKHSVICDVVANGGRLADGKCVGSRGQTRGHHRRSTAVRVFRASACGLLAADTCTKRRCHSRDGHHILLGHLRLAARISIHPCHRQRLTSGGFHHGTNGCSIVAATAGGRETVECRDCVRQEYHGSQPGARLPFSLLGLKFACRTMLIRKRPLSKHFASFCRVFVGWGVRSHAIYSQKWSLFCGCCPAMDRSSLRWLVTRQYYVTTRTGSVDQGAGVRESVNERIKRTISTPKKNEPAKFDGRLLNVDEQSTHNDRTNTIFKHLSRRNTGAIKLLPG